MEMKQEHCGEEDQRNDVREQCRELLLELRNDSDD